MVFFHPHGLYFSTVPRDQREVTSDNLLLTVVEKEGDVVAAAFGRKVMIFLLSSMKIIPYQLPHPPPQRATQVSSLPPFEKLKN